MQTSADVRNAAATFDLPDSNGVGGHGGGGHYGSTQGQGHGHSGQGGKPGNGGNDMVVSGGALTFAMASILTEVYRSGTRISVLELIEKMRGVIKEKGLFQVPQLSSSCVMDLDTPFTLDTTLVQAYQEQHGHHKPAHHATQRR